MLHPPFRIGTPHNFDPAYATAGLAFLPSTTPGVYPLAVLGFDGFLRIFLISQGGVNSGVLVKEIDVRPLFSYASCMCAVLVQGVAMLLVGGSACQSKKDMGRLRGSHGNITPGGHFRAWRVIDSAPYIGMGLGW